MPHLSATVPWRFRIAEWELLISVIEYAVINWNQNKFRNLKSAIELGGSKGFEPSFAAVTVRCSAPLSYDPQKNFGLRILRMWNCERLLSGLSFSNPKSEFHNPKFDGARGEIRTHHRADLKSAASAIWATRAMILSWYSRRDSNPHCTVFETVVSCRLDYASKCCIKRATKIERDMTLDRCSHVQHSPEIGRACGIRTHASLD